MPIAPVAVYIQHEDQNTPTKAGFATKAAFVYESVPLDKVAVYGYGVTDGQRTKEWPDTRSLPFLVTNGETELTFDSVRRFDAKEADHGHAQCANKRMSDMICKTRKLAYPMEVGAAQEQCVSDDPCQCRPNRIGLGGAHGDCLSPQMIVSSQDPLYAKALDIDFRVRD